MGHGGFQAFMRPLRLGCFCPHFAERRYSNDCSGVKGSAKEPSLPGVSPSEAAAGTRWYRAAEVNNQAAARRGKTQFGRAKWQV
jgi:hypothetical protein